jgi:hypothetical protein
MTRLACITLVLAAAAAACGKGGDNKEAAKGKPAGGGELPADHVAAVNAAVPAELKGQLAFEAGRVVTDDKRDRGFKAAVPKGWKKGGVIPGTLLPPDADDFGSSKTFGKSRMNIGSNCDGDCVKKDWPAIANKVLFSQFTTGKVEGKVLKDEKRPNGRTLVFERKPSMFPEQDVAIYVYTSWWEPDATEYFTCGAELGLPLKGAADAFEKACAKVIKDDKQ